jgi:hypothetical protein
MKIIFNSIALLLMMWLTSSCNSMIMGKGYDYHHGWARVEDSIVGGKYEIIAVNGQPTTRMQHGQMITIAPIAVIPEGEHTLTIQKFNFGLDQTNSATDIKV